MVAAAAAPTDAEVWRRLAYVLGRSPLRFILGMEQQPSPHGAEHAVAVLGVLPPPPLPPPVGE